MRNTIAIHDPFFREFDGLVRRAFAGSDEARSAAVVPPADTYRDGDDAVIRLDLPGVEVTEVELEVVGRQLVVSGERRDTREEERTGQHLREVRYGSFRRAFRLAPSVTADQVSASYDAGVLTIRVANAYAETKGQRIEIGSPEQAAAEPTEG